jgi:Bacteriocin-protection, YdeI or OmpD-Associated
LLVPSGSCSGKAVHFDDKPQRFIRSYRSGGVKTPSRSHLKPGERRELVVPDYLTAALKKHKVAKKNFENFSYSHKKE